MPRVIEPISYKIFNILPRVRRSDVHDILSSECHGRLVDVHFNGRQGINMVFEVQSELKPEERKRIVAGIAKLMPGSGSQLLSIQKEANFQVRDRRPTRLLRVIGFAVDKQDHSAPLSLPKAWVEKIAFDAADWVSEKVRGEADVCTVEYVAKPGKRPVLNAVLQLPTEEAVEVAMERSRSTLDMLAVPYPGGDAYVYVSQPGDKPKWYADRVKRTDCHKRVFEGADRDADMPQQMQAPSNMSDDYCPRPDDDNWSRVPAAGYNAGLDAFDAIGSTGPHPLLFAEMLYHLTDGYNAGSYDFDGRQQYMAAANGCSIAASGSQPYHAFTGTPVCAPAGCTYEPVEPTAAANGCSIAAFAQPYQSDAPLPAPAGCTYEPVESRCMSESADDMDAVLPYL